MRSLFPRLAALLLALLLCCCGALADDDTACTWDFADGMLVLSVTTADEDAESWSATVSEPDMLTLLRDEFETSEADEENDAGVWVTTWEPYDGAAGIAELRLVCHSMGSDEPTAAFLLEVYLDGEGTMTVLTLNGEEVAMLPVD